jgi:acetolactate synthase-1/2/3 large subunit
MPSAFYESGPIFHYATVLQDPSELPGVAARLAQGLDQPTGFVAHVAIPLALQAAPATPLALDLHTFPGIQAHRTTIEHCVKKLASSKFAIWVGFGARHAAHQVRQLAERSGAAVFSTPRSKGIFDETHRQYLGVTGLGSHVSVQDYTTRG